MVGRQVVMMKMRSRPHRWSTLLTVQTTGHMFASWWALLPGAAPRQACRPACLQRPQRRANRPGGCKRLRYNEDSGGGTEDESEPRASCRLQVYAVAVRVVTRAGSLSSPVLWLLPAGNSGEKEEAAVRKLPRLSSQQQRKAQQAKQQPESHPM
jgi:hypothetical protein